MTAWLTAAHAVASSAQSAAEHVVCLDVLSFVFPPRYPARRCVPCSVWLAQAEQTPEQTVCTGSEIPRLHHPNPTVSIQIQMNLPPMRLHGPRRPILRQILGILPRSGGLVGGMTDDLQLFIHARLFRDLRCPTPAVYLQVYIHHLSVRLHLKHSG